jgi:hypothetical protein
MRRDAVRLRTHQHESISSQSLVARLFDEQTAFHCNAEYSLSTNKRVLAEMVVTLRNISRGSKNFVDCNIAGQSHS